MNTKTYKVQMEIAGNTAMWTRPDCGDSPCSYPAPTYSAVRGLFESILWGPAIIVHPTKVELCTPPQFHSYKTNYGGPLRITEAIKKKSNYQLFATVLIDVCYRMYAEVYANPLAQSQEDSPWKRWKKNTTSPGHAYQSIFNRRLKRGQYYATPCLGWSEFIPSYIGPFRESTHVCSDLPDIQISSMLRLAFPDGYNTEYNAVYDTNVCIHKGVLSYPERKVEP